MGKYLRNVKEKYFKSTPNTWNMFVQFYQLFKNKLTPEQKESVFRTIDKMSWDKGYFNEKIASFGRTMNAIFDKKFIKNVKGDLLSSSLSLAATIWWLVSSATASNYAASSSHSLSDILVILAAGCLMWSIWFTVKIMLDIENAYKLARWENAVNDYTAVLETPNK